MDSVADRLIHMAATSSIFLERESRRAIARFILSRQNADGGFSGRDQASDLYYTLFAAAGLRALGWRLPIFRLWKYVRSFGSGEDLDLVHLVCLIRLRGLFPMLAATRRRLLAALDRHDSGTAYDPFIRLMAADASVEERAPEQALRIAADSPTTTIAAGMIVNSEPDEAAQNLLMGRVCPTGGFAPVARVGAPDLLSTATALFALADQGADLDQVREPCMEYIESLWRDSGGFAGHAADEFEDVEYTFYGLLSIGCLMA
jgi:prenyltransferase beta subunit